VCVLKGNFTNDPFVRSVSIAVMIFVIFNLSSV